MSVNFAQESSNFLIEDEIKYIVEGMTVNLNAVTTIKFVHDDRLPNYV